MSDRILVIDGQIFQTSAFDRGMGRYTICLLGALKECTDIRIVVLLSSRIKVNEAHERSMKTLLKGFDIVHLDLLPKDCKIEKAFAHNRSVISEYVDGLGSKNIDFFIPALFQEPTVSVFPRECRTKSLLMHDLIPYLFHDRYSRVMAYDDYLKRFRYIFEADLILTNSQTVADDLAMYLGIPKSKLCRIDGAAIHTDKVTERPNIEGIDGRFILLNTSDDPRKNNLRSVLGFEEYCKVTNDDLNLVITSAISDREKKNLKQISSKIIFTGNLPDGQLDWLFKNCELLLFAPECEGLGLPVLEAVDADKPIVCSSIPVIQEISKIDTEAFHYCDYKSSHSIALAIGSAINNQLDYRLEYRRIKSYYTWVNAAKRMLDGLNNFANKKTFYKPKIAIFTASPGGMSGVGLTTNILHPAISEYFEVEYYIERGLSNKAVRPDYLQYVAPCYPAQVFSVKRYAKYDAVFYHLGNGDYHIESIKNALYLPGYAILHDATLTEAFRVMGELGMMSAERIRLEAAIEKSMDINMSKDFVSIANRQLGIITHSTYGFEAAQEVLVNPVAVVKTGLPTNTPNNNNVRTSGKTTIGLAGAIADVKGIGLIERIAEDVAFQDCDIKLFGFNHASQDKIDKLNSYPNVVVSTDVSDYDFQTSIASLDIFLNYRMEYKGETSNTTLEAMRQGVVTIVRDIGWFAEQSDKAVVKVKSPDDAIEELKRLIIDHSRVKRIGDNAKEYVANNFNQERYVQAILEVLGMDRRNNPNELVAEMLVKGYIKSAKEMITRVFEL